MLEAAMKDQLKEVFLRLERDVILRATPSRHPDQGELMAMLGDLAETSNKIHFELATGEDAAAPSFSIATPDGPTGVRFRGVPGGHEFTSVIIAILNADGKGKRPDEGVIRRIRALKGPIRLRTYMSLTCENCPDVVQALNLMASLHPDFEHETVDGSNAQDEIEALGIQGVPSVIGDASGSGKLLHSGKIQLLDLLGKLEQAYGVEAAAQSAAALDLGRFDVVVIGGGPAGASSAIYSVRKGLKTAIVAERFGGQLQDTKGIENMISMPYTEGAKLSAQLSEHLAQYPVQLFEHRRVREINGDAVKRIVLESGETIEAGAVIVATGATWRKLGIPGEKENIGQGVAFCAHCDGPFYKGKRVAVVGGGNSGVEAAIDLANIAEHVTLLEYGPVLKADDVLVEKLQALANAKIVTQAKSTQVLSDGKKVTGLEYENLHTRELAKLEVDGVFVQIGLLPNTGFLKGVVDLTPNGEIVVDAKGRTSVAGIYAAGDVTTIPFKQIVVAMGDGAKAALAAFEDRLHSKTA